jgi:hypothetical protein
VLLNTIGMCALLMSASVHWEHYEANAREGDESGRPANQINERITQKYQEYQALQLGGFFMSRILGVRNDLELKLLRELGIMAVCRLIAYLSDHRNSY